MTHRNLPPRVCENCGQPLRLHRVGVWLPVVKAAIYDAIHAAGDIGVSVDELRQLDVWRDRKRPGFDGIKSHVQQLNEHYLADVGLRIIRDDRRLYVLTHTRAATGDAA